MRLSLTPKTVGATCGLGGVVFLREGEFVCEHYHPYSEEFVHVVAGNVTMRVGDEEVPLGPGDALVVPIGVRHRVTHGGGEPAHLVFHLCPLAPRPELGHVDTEHLPDAELHPLPDVGSPVDGSR